MVKIICTESEKDSIKNCANLSDNCFLGCQRDREELGVVEEYGKCNRDCYNCLEEYVYWDLIDRKLFDRN